MAELTPELEIMLELLRGWEYDVYPTVVLDRVSSKKAHPAIQVQIKPKGLYYKIWATERNHLHLRLLLWRDGRLLEGDEGFDEAFDQLTIGTLKAAVRAAEDIYKAWLLIFRVLGPNQRLGLGFLFFARVNANELGSMDVAAWLREYLGKKLAEVVDYPKALQSA